MGSMRTAAYDQMDGNGCSHKPNNVDLNKSMTKNDKWVKGGSKLGDKHRGIDYCYLEVGKVETPVET